MSVNPEPTTGTKRPAADPAESSKTKRSKYADQRKNLGASFGTRKAQKVQANRESNIIDTSNLGSVMDSLVESINEKAKTVPTRESVQAKQDEMRPVPKYHLEAENPQDIYRLEDIILPNELEAMKSQISSLKKTTDEASRKILLGYRNSTYLNNRLRRTFDVEDGKKPDSTRLRVIYFASLLLSLYINRRQVGDREKLSAKLNNPPSVLLESLVGRFADQNKVDDRNADRILTHLFVLGLHLDNFATELRTLQEDLQLRPPQIAMLYKELGCTVAPLTETQRTAAGLTKSEAKSLKRAVLKAPLIFPPPKRGPAKK